MNFIMMLFGMTVGFVIGGLAMLVGIYKEQLDKKPRR